MNSSRNALTCGDSIMWIVDGGAMKTDTAIQARGIKAKSINTHDESFRPRGLEDGLNLEDATVPPSNGVEGDDLTMWAVSSVRFVS